MDFTLDSIRERIKHDALRAEHAPIIERGLPKMTPMEYIKAGRIFIGFEVDDDLLPYMVNKYGTDCWVYASDIPHAHRKPDSPKIILNRTDLPQSAKEKILRHGTAKLYGLNLPAMTKAGYIILGERWCGVRPRRPSWGYMVAG